MRKIILYGELAKRFGKYHSFAVKSAAEAIRALRANFEGFESFMCSAHNQNLGFRVYIGHDGLEKSEDVHTPSGERDVIRIVPVVMGSKSPFIKILIGAALIAAALTIPGLGQAALIIGAMGASMVIGGVSQLLTSIPQTPQFGAVDRKTSYIFDGPANSSAQGTAIPVGYGRMIVGSKIISAGIETHEA